MTYVCEICESTISTNKNIIKHQNTEKCRYIKSLLDKRDKLNNEKNNIIQKENESLKSENIKLKYENKENETKIKLLQDKCDEYRTIVENSINNIQNNNKLINNNKISNDNLFNETTFQIDINVNNKQLNKTKYKDIPEEQVKNSIQSLKLKDSYQLEYRENDGFINITNLCKAGGKKFNDWNRLDKTKKFLDVLSATTGIPVVELLKQEQGGNGERHTWAHPQVAINIAQWISPEFDVLVSKWVYEIMLTGKVDIRENKTTQELDQMNKENKLLKNRVKLLESKVLQKQP